MASSLRSIQYKFPIKSIISHVLRKNYTENITCLKCRPMMSIAINSETEIQDALPAEETYHQDKTELTDLRALKQKEKGDWRFLTMEEKKKLYQLSFSQPVCETLPGDEWKTILGSTFTAMGVITMGIYIWFTQFGFHNFEKVPFFTTDQIADKQKLMVDFINEKIGDANFDSLPRS